MTYPQYPVYGQPAPAYAPPAQPQPAAPSYPDYPPAPQSAPPAAYVAPVPPSQGQSIAPPMPTLRDGGGQGGAAAPKMRHLQGRTIIVEPLGMGETKNPETNQIVPEARFNLTVVDGGALQYGDSQSRDPAKQRPNTHEIDTPCRFTNVTDIGFGFVQAVRESLESGEPGRVGVVQRGTKGNFPYLITKTSTDVEGNARPDGEARFAAAMAIFGKIWADKHAPAGAPRQFVSPEPRSLVAPPAAAPQQVSYAPPPPAAAPAYGYGQPAAPAPQSAPPAAYPPGYGQYAPQPSAFAQAAAPELQAMAAQVPPHVEQWLASLPDEQRAGALAQYLAHNPATTPQPAAAGPGI